MFDVIVHLLCSFDKFFEQKTDGRQLGDTVSRSKSRYGLLTFTKYLVWCPNVREPLVWSPAWSLQHDD